LTFLGNLCQDHATEVFIMATMNVSLPDPMKEWVEAQAQTGRYSNASDYVRDLIRRDQERVSKLAELQRLITEGLDSGISDRSIGDVLEAARKQAEAARHQ
jgi:antitoxin ParD1/3/4